MKKIFEICSELRPLTTIMNSFIAGIFFYEKMYWFAGVMLFVVVINLPYLKSK